MGRIIKALILGWIGKKAYDYTLGRNEPETEPAPKPARTARAPKQAPKRKAA